MSNNHFENVKSTLLMIKEKIDKHCTVISGILFALIAFYLIPTPLGQVYPGLDNSWITSLSLLAESIYQFGTDVTFTYGPLGFLVVPRAINSALIPSVIFWISAFVILLAALGYIIFKILPANRRVWGTALFAVILYLFGTPGLEKYFTIIAFVLLLAAWFAENKSKLRYLFFTLTCVYMAIMFFVKLNAGLEIFGAILIFLVAAFIQKDKIRIGALCITIVTALVSFIVLLAYTGSIGGLFHYILDCVEIVSGYNIGMSYTLVGNGLFTGIISLFRAGAILLVLFILDENALRLTNWRVFS